MRFFSGETIKLKENPINKRLEFDLSESSKRYEELFEVIFFLWSCSKEIGFLTALFLITLRNLSTTSLMPTKLLEVKVVD